MSRRTLLSVVGIAALAAGISAVVASSHQPDRQSAAARPSVKASATPNVLHPAQRNSPRSSPNASTRSSRPAATGSEGPFSVVIQTSSEPISAQVDSISVASNQPVDPPHSTAKQWDTAVWVKESTYPSGASIGTSYVYGHACHHHVCPFTRLKDAAVGDQVTVQTATQTLRYVIRRSGLSPRTANSLPSWAADSTVPNRLVLVTCAFEKGDTSRDNIVVVAQLEGR